MNQSPSARALNLIAGHSARSADARRAALRLFVPEDGDAPVLTPFLLSVAADADEDDLVRIEAIRVLPISYIPEGDPAGAVRAALIRLAVEDADHDIRSTAGYTVFDLPGAEDDVPRMRELIAAEQIESVAESIDASLELFLARRKRRGVVEEPSG